MGGSGSSESPEHGQHLNGGVKGESATHGDPDEGPQRMWQRLPTVCGQFVCWRTRRYLRREIEALTGRGWVVIDASEATETAPAVGVKCL
jgi:hypothetical protein